MKYLLNIILLLFLSVNIASGADVFANRVGETTSTTGTGTISLIGAKTGYRTFVAGVGDGNSCKYLIITNTGAWEIGSGTVTDAGTDTLSRDSVENSTNGDAKVNFSAGTKDVYCIVSASQFSGFSATELSTGTVNATTYGITSDGGADDIVLVEADTDNAGLLGADKWDEVVASTTHGSDNSQAHTDYLLNTTDTGTGLFDFGTITEDGNAVPNIMEGATPSSGDTTHFSTADQIYDWVIGLSYSTYTNLTSFVDQTAWRIFYSNTDGDVVEVPLGATNTFFGSGGTTSAPSFQAIGDADVPDTITIDNATLAADATKLATPRTIAGVSFDGSANINIPSTGLSDTADLLYETELDSFSELQSQIGDKTLINEEDAITLDSELTIDATLFIKEQADASADKEAYGQIWINTASPNELWWTDDEGTDTQLGVASGGGTTYAVLAITSEIDSITNRTIYRNTGQTGTMTTTLPTPSDSVEPVVFEVMTASYQWNLLPPAGYHFLLINSSGTSELSNNHMISSNDAATAKGDMIVIHPSDDGSALYIAVVVAGTWTDGGL